MLRRCVPAPRCHTTLPGAEFKRGYENLGHKLTTVNDRVGESVDFVQLGQNRVKEPRFPVLQRRRAGSVTWRAGSVTWRAGSVTWRAGSVTWRAGCVSFRVTPGCRSRAVNHTARPSRRTWALWQHVIMRFSSASTRLRFAPTGACENSRTIHRPESVLSREAKSRRDD
jgi:hypothetical protein